MYIARWGQSARAFAFCAVGALAACEGSTALPVDVRAPAPVVEVVPVVRPDEVAAPVPEYGLPLGVFHFTMYYVAAEDEYPQVAAAPTTSRQAANDNHDSSGLPDSVSDAPDSMSDAPDSVSGAPDDEVVTLFHRKGCTPLAKVSPSFGAQLDIQGTGKLRDGRVINTSGNCQCPKTPCYFEIERAWAMGPNGRLAPFRSVAVDSSVIPLGTLLYLPELDGVRVPGRAPWGGFVHDGCVVADDRGGGIRGRDIDFFVAKKTYSNILDARHRFKHVAVFGGEGWCERDGTKTRRAAGRIAL